METGSGWGHFWNNFLSWLRCTSCDSCPSNTHLPALNAGLQLFQSFQFLHLPLGLIDVGADGLHGLQCLFHCWVVGMLFWSPLQQLLGRAKRTWVGWVLLLNFKRQEHEKRKLISLLCNYTMTLTLRVPNLPPLQLERLVGGEDCFFHCFFTNKHRHTVSMWCGLWCFLLGLQVVVVSNQGVMMITVLWH